MSDLVKLGIWNDPAVRGAPKEHPAVKSELQLRAFICRTLSRLGVTDEPTKPVGRPGQGLGISYEEWGLG